MDGAGPSPHRQLSGWSALEALPNVLLENVFLSSGNGNLLLASPRVSVKLSGSQTLYVAVFLIAFYSHQLEETLQVFSIEHFTSILPLPIPSWSTRSLTKAVLWSRWCTLGWTREFFLSLKRLAVKNCLSIVNSGGSLSRDRDRDLCALRSYRSELDYLNTLAPFYDFDVSFTYDSPTWHKLQGMFSGCETPLVYLRRFEWRFCGGGAFIQNHISSPVTKGTPTTPFREVIDYGISQELRGRESFAGLDYCIHSREATSQTLVENLALNFYYHPENQPFTIDPLLFRIAAMKDILRKQTSPRDAWKQFMILFRASPASLPRTDPVLIPYAAHIFRRINGLERQKASIRFSMRGLQRQGELNHSIHREATKWFTEIQYLQQMDYQVLEYITLGSLREPNCDQMSPKIGLDLGDRWSKPIPEKIYIAEESEGDRDDMEREVNQRMRETPLLQAYLNSPLHEQCSNHETMYNYVTPLPNVRESGTSRRYCLTEKPLVEKLPEGHVDSVDREKKIDEMLRSGLDWRSRQRLFETQLWPDDSEPSWARPPPQRPVVRAICCLRKRIVRRYYEPWD